MSATTSGRGPSLILRGFMPGAEHELAVCAWEAAGGTPPARADIWNFPGYLGNAWHRLTVTVK